ncbi:putative ferric-chelate reductase 1 homolog [Microplitis demolitor]|uniref:putative ferric-chelate reductase 1 homolog n=1 Tax=Microplitis demolitor TaxID=69319 RepID=UPI0004CDC43C|nr:putative ferric-chelate reductase 1 homolog [Microplitis demolitor]
MNYLILKLILLCMATKILGLPDGAPLKACFDLIPHHSTTSSLASYPPYEIRAIAGQHRIHMTLGSPQGFAFQGFIINARDVETGELVGEFIDLPSTVQALQCTPGINNTVTHKDKVEKRNLELDWITPEDYEGTVIFNSTFLQDYATYWVGVESPRITVLRDSIQVMTTIPPPTTERTTTTPYYELDTQQSTESTKRHPIYEGCGSTKNCFGSSDRCIEEGLCNAVVTVEVKGEKYIFELLGMSSKYVAVGLSDDPKMGEDSVVECTDENGRVEIHMSWNNGKTNSRIATPSGTLSILNRSIVNGALYCKFTRDRTTLVQGREFDLANRAYCLLLASGTSLKSNGVGFHDLAYRGSDKPIKLADIREIVASSDLLIRIHGALMIASWIGTASIGILMARYYKQTWLRSPICGKDQWFAWHRFFMILTWSMTIAAFVIIFVELGTWSTETLHASLGLATTVLAFVQPFMAALRPHPGTPRRPLFNWAHWFIGNAAHICAVIALFFAVRLNKAKLPDWVDWVLTAYVVFHVLTHIILSFAGCAADRQDNQSINAFPMKDMHVRGSIGHTDLKRDAPLGGLRKLVFGVYFVIIAVFAAALIVITVMAPIGESWDKFTRTISTY